MKDMDRAVAMILDHVQEGHRIEVIGDYDVDGMSASAILGRVLQRLGASVRVRIPDRVEDGYGNPALYGGSMRAGRRLADPDLR